MDAQPESSARFEQAFREQYGRVLSYARRRAPADVADDVVAETFLTAWRRMDDLPRLELPWLLGVARRVLANQRRRAAAQRRLAERVAAEPDAGAAPFASADERLVDVLSRLPERDRELLTLVAWDGLSPSDAAGVLGCSAVSARVRLHRARRRLAAMLEDDSEIALPAVLTRPAKETR